MTSLLLFLGTILLLTVEGRWLVAIIARGNLTRMEEWALGFPLAACMNALLFFLLTIFAVPLNAVAVFGGHLLILLIIFFGIKVLSSDKYARSLGVLAPLSGIRSPEKSTHDARGFSILTVLLILVVFITLLYGISHALLPTYFYDSVSQWTMRAKISYVDHAIAFDLDELRGMSKPQYPILLHSLQIIPMLAMGQWSDLAANTATLFLTLTSFVALYLLTVRSAGVRSALLALGGILTIPLLSMHLAQGYGDLSVMTYLLLSAILLCLSLQLKEGSTRLLFLSALFCAASAWVKQEGLLFGVVPWIVVVLCEKLRCWWFAREHNPLGRGGGFRSVEVWGCIGAAVLLAVPWMLLLLWKGLPLSPHGGGDLSLSFHANAVPEAFRQLFAAGSFGVHWYVAIGMFLFVLFEQANSLWAKKRVGKITVSKTEGLLESFCTDRTPCSGIGSAQSERSVLLWACIVLVEALAIFLCTPNVQFLLNAQTFSRTMLLPLSLLLLGVSIALPRLCARRDDALA